MRALLASILVAAAALPTAANAQSFDQPVSATIAYADLDLDSAAGRIALQGRVKVAANRLCHDLTISPITEVTAVENCRASMAHSARQQLETGALRSLRGALLASR